MNKTIILYTLLLQLLCLTNACASEANTWYIKQSAKSTTNPYISHTPITGSLTICQAKENNSDQYELCAIFAPNKNTDTSLTIKNIDEGTKKLFNLNPNLRSDLPSTPDINIYLFLENNNQNLCLQINRIFDKRYEFEELLNVPQGTLTPRGNCIDLKYQGKQIILYDQKNREMIQNLIEDRVPFVMKLVKQNKDEAVIKIT